MKKHIILSLLISAVMLAPNAAVFANIYPAYDPNASTSTPAQPQLHGDPVPKAECLTIKSNITFGSANNQVAALQKLLSDAGFFNGSQTGYFGTITLKSVKTFQNKYGIPATGFVGPLTRAKIIAELCKLEPVILTPTSSIHITSPQAGDGWARDTVKKITWTDSNTYIQAQKYDITLSPKSPCVPGKPCTLMLIRPYTIASGTTLTTDGYSWTVGSTIDTDRTIPDGDYTINVCPTGGSGNCAQSGLFTIGTLDPVATSTITQLSPNAGPVGTKIHIVTTFFNDVNHINFGTGYIPKSAITVGNGYVEFAAPSSLDPDCFYSQPRCYIASTATTPNKYWVSLTLNNGNKTNKLPFTVSQSGTGY